MTTVGELPLGERGAECRKAAGDFPDHQVMTPLEDLPLGERGAGKGGFPGPALSVRLFAGHALPTVKSQIPELLSEGGSGSRSRLTVTLRSRGFDAVASMWRARERAVKSSHVLGCRRFPRRLHSDKITWSASIGGVVTATPLPDGDATGEARKSFHESLEELRTDVIRLAALTIEAVAGGTQALLDGDLNAAEDVIEADDVIDELTHTIEDRTFLLLARQQPLATDLRFLVTVMRVAHELERSADLMVNVAKTTRRLYPHQLDPKLRGIIDRMGTQASNQTRVAIDAFADADPSWAAALADMDDAMDELTKSLFRHVLAGDGSDEGAVLLAVQMALVGRHYERIADHAVTIAERVGFMVTGEHPNPDADPRARGLTLSCLRRSRGPTRG